MINAVASTEALPNRRSVFSKGTGAAHWCTDFIGRHSQYQSTDGPEAFLIEMSPAEAILPHFHEIDQFQIFVAGRGRMGRKTALPLAVHYADSYTGYGPIVAGPQGFSMFTLHAVRDPGAVYRHKPGYQEKHKPGKKRQRLAPAIVLSTAPVLQSLAGAVVEPLFDDEGLDDGLGAFIARLGAGQKWTGPDPARTGGQYYLVVNGVLELSGASYPLWSAIFVSGDEPPVELMAGAGGAEALVLQFPR
ncbi:MAG TPA: hypothetical protein VD867_05010 [Burkholderiales bacterium]|nr:hypothetical protein [Burkholderiales bacterium]